MGIGFNGSTNSYSKSESDLPALSNCSVSLWFQDANTDVGGTTYLVEFYDTLTASTLGIWTANGTAGYRKVVAQCHNGSLSTTIQGDQYVHNSSTTWHHVLVSLQGPDGSGSQFKITLDNGTATTGTSYLPAALDASIIGDSEAGSENFKGTIGELTAWDAVLTVVPIGWLYGGMNPVMGVVNQDIVLHAPMFNDNATEIWPWIGGAVFSGTGSLAEEHPPVFQWGETHYGQALLGSDAYTTAQNAGCRFKRISTSDTEVQTLPRQFPLSRAVKRGL